MGLQTYGKILALGSSDRRVAGILDGPVVVQEKIDGCVTPDMRILTADLRHVRAGDLVVGDHLIGFDDKTNDPRLCESVVTHAKPITKRVFRVITDRGAVEASSDHPWLAYGKANNGKRWIETESLSEGDDIVFIGTWEDERSYDAGYLAGQYDGEGSLVRSGSGRILSFYQKIGPEFDLVCDLLTERGFSFRIDSRRREDHYLECGSIVLTNGWIDILRFLGSIRPNRLLSKAKDKIWDGAPMNGLSRARVISIEEIGQKTVIGLSTSTKTYIAEGMLCHNSQFSFEVDSMTGDLLIRSKGQMIECFDAADQLFASSIRTVIDCFDKGMLEPGYIYRGEAQYKEKHVTITYGRVARGHIILFDVVKPDGTYMTMKELEAEAGRLGVESSQVFFDEEIVTVDQLKDLIGTESMLGGHTIEGVVIKNYHDWFTHGDGSTAPKRAKLVDELFKEKHKKDWQSENPNRSDIIASLVAELSSKVRYNKCVQRLRENGELEGDPRDIGKLMKMFYEDIMEEEASYIKDRLFEAFIKNIIRGAGKDLPYWYKDKLLADLEEDEDAA